MKDTNPIQEESLKTQPAKKNAVLGDESTSMQEKTSLEETWEEKTINLNELFPDTEADLNNLFPDNEIKHLLKNIIKNKKDMGLIKERLATENEISK